MGFESSSIKIYNLVQIGQLIALLYTICSSIIAIKRSSNSEVQQWLMYWVVFVLVTRLEHTVPYVHEWFVVWPYAKMAITCWLVLPYFSGAAYVYENILRPCYSLTHEKEKVEKLTWMVGFGLKVNQDAFQPSDQEKTQKDWSCTLCFVSTTSEANLEEHYQGKKHKAKMDELKVNEMELQKEGISGQMQHATNGMDIADDFNQVNPTARQLRLVSWEKPLVGWIKLNTDGSVNPKNAGLGGLLRDHNGIPICAFVSKASRDGIFLLELWAIWRGLVLALSEGIRAISVESDSHAVVKLINKKQDCPPNARRYLKGIWKRLEKFDKQKVSFAYREANRAADHLAKMSIDGDDVVLRPTDFPESLHKIIKEDADGKSYYRNK